MNILEAHNTRRQFLRTLVGGVALAAMPALPIVAEDPVQHLIRMTMEMDVSVRNVGWMMHPKFYRMIRDMQTRDGQYRLRHDARLARRIAAGLPYRDQPWVEFQK